MTKPVRGTKVVALVPKRALTKDFPGWGQETPAHFTTVPAGTHGVIDSVNYHGSNPYTRYCVRWADGSRTIDAYPTEIGLAK